MRKLCKLKVVSLMMFFSSQGCFLFPNDSPSTVSGKKALKEISEVISASSLIETTGYMSAVSELLNKTNYCEKFQNTSNTKTFSEQIEKEVYNNPNIFEIPESRGEIYKVNVNYENDKKTNTRDIFYYNRGNSSARTVYVQKQGTQFSACRLFTSDKSEETNDSCCYRNSVRITKKIQSSYNNYSSPIEIPVPTLEEDFAFTVTPTLGYGYFVSHTYFFEAKTVYLAESRNMTYVIIDTPRSGAVSSYSYGTDIPGKVKLTVSKGSHLYLLYDDSDPYVVGTEVRTIISLYSKETGKLDADHSSFYTGINDPLLIPNGQSSTVIQTGAWQATLNIKKHTYMECYNSVENGETILFSLTPFYASPLSQMFSGPSAENYVPDSTVGGPLIAKASNQIRLNRKYSRSSVEKCKADLKQKIPVIYAANAESVKASIACGISGSRIEPYFSSGKICDLEESGRILQYEDFGL